MPNDEDGNRLNHRYANLVLLRKVAHPVQEWRQEPVLSPGRISAGPADSCTWATRGPFRHTVGWQNASLNQNNRCQSPRSQSRR